MNIEIAPKSTEIRANWYDAKLYCFALNIGGKTGWRLPTKDELNRIYESDNDFVDSGYWSSTEYGGSSAWEQGFYNGLQYNFDKNFGFYVRAVRDLL